MKVNLIHIYIYKIIAASIPSPSGDTIHMYNSPCSFLPVFTSAVRVNDTYIAYLNGKNRETPEYACSQKRLPIVALAVFHTDDKKTET